MPSHVVKRFLRKGTHELSNLTRVNVVTDGCASPVLKSNQGTRLARSIRNTGALTGVNVALG